MYECRPVPCPEFQEVSLRVEAECNCGGHAAPGNSECPIHGGLIRHYMEGAQRYDLGQGFADDPR